MKQAQSLFPSKRAAKLLLPALALVLFSCVPAFSQTVAPLVPEPRREQLLNGLKMLLVSRPGDAEVTLKLRIHSGAAFDLAGKEGMMALLSDALFADATREYVKEELDGRLEVTTNYDSINVLLTGRADSFERLAELLRNALLNTQLTPEIVARLREARIKTVREIGVAPGTIADRAIAARLYGAYPYGRLASGTPETLARIERSDLLLLQERFLGSNNATLVVIGGVESARALRALRQFLGGWRKGDRNIPATFRQPENPDTRTLIIGLPGAPDAEVRLALRGVARSERDNAAAIVLALLAQDRWKAAAPELKDRAVSVRHDAHLLSGVFYLSASVSSPAMAAQAIEAAHKMLHTLTGTPVASTEFEAAKRAAVATLGKELEKSESLADIWLDAQTYGNHAANTLETMRAIDALTPADLQQVAARLFLEKPIASVVVGDASKLSAELARLGEFEVLGAAASVEPSKEHQKPSQPAPTIQLKRP